MGSGIQAIDKTNGVEMPSILVPWQIHVTNS